MPEVDLLFKRKRDLKTNEFIDIHISMYARKISCNVIMYASLRMHLLDQNERLWENTYLQSCVTVLFFV